MSYTCPKCHCFYQNEMELAIHSCDVFASPEPQEVIVTSTLAPSIPLIEFVLMPDKKHYMFWDTANECKVLVKGKDIFSTLDIKTSLNDDDFLKYIGFIPEEYLPERVKAIALSDFIDRYIKTRTPDGSAVLPRSVEFFYYQKFETKLLETIFNNPEIKLAEGGIHFSNIYLSEKQYQDINLNDFIVIISKFYKHNLYFNITTAQQLKLEIK